MRMEKKYPDRSIILFGLLAALLLIILPASAVNGTISIAYRGSGGNYLGDTIIFDGYNTFSNVTLIRMTGPGLPAEGVPVYDMNGQAGSGNLAPVNDRGLWKFAWYSGSAKGMEKLQTARYYFTAFDNTYPDKTATTSVLLKKPEFYVVASPNLARYGDYIQLTGISEKASSSVHFAIADSSGKIVHSYDSTVSASGYYNQGFHIDMPPGVYSITLTSPSSKAIYRNYLTVNMSETPAPVSGTADQTGTGAVSPPPSGSSLSSDGTGSSPITSSPAGARSPLSILPAITGLVIVFAIVVLSSKHR
jgi:hypothetical protein